MEGRRELAALDAEEDILVEGLRFSEWEADRLGWSMEAERVRYHHRQSMAYLEEVDVTLFPPGGGKMFLRAKRVDFDVKTQDLFARESIRGRSDQGYVFYTERLFYDGENREVTTDDKVTLEKDRLSIQGVGMKGSLSDHKFRLLSSVSAVFAPAGAAP